MDVHIHRDYSLTVAERRQRLADTIRDIRSRLGPEAMRLFDDLLNKWQQGGDPPPELEILWDCDYIRKPVPIREFIHDPFYLGQTLGNGFIFERIVDDLEELFEGDYSEVVLGGSIGWGKSRMAEVGNCYDIYCVSCLKNPAAAYGMMPGSTMAFVNVSVKKEQAQKVMFGGMFEMMKRSPYFRKVFPYKPNLLTEIRFPKNVVCYPVAATEQAVLGEGIFSASIDEANFMQTVEKSKRSVPGDTGMWDQATALYNRLARRLRSRMNVRGKLPGHLWLVSSARYPDDFTEKKEREARAGDKRIFVRHYASWETKPKTSFTGGWFKFEVGDLTKRSRVLKGDETDVNPLHVLDIPNDFKEDFLRDPEGCCRDFAGVATLSIKPFIPRRELIERMLQLGAENGLKHPFTKYEVTLQGERAELEHLVPENLHWIEVPMVDDDDRPVLDPKTGKPKMVKKLYPALYSAHFDLAKNGDAAGLVVGHVVGTKECKRHNGVQVVVETKPIIRIDLVLRCVHPAGGEIDIPRLRAVIYQLRELGMHFFRVTFDTFGSQESVKTMTDDMFNAEAFSVDTSNDPYEVMKRAIYDERVMCYDQPKEEMRDQVTLQLELAQLENTGKKIDHPVKGSKDMADCLAAVVWHCEDGYRVGALTVPFVQGIVERQSEELMERAMRGEALSLDELNQLGK